MANKQSTSSPTEPALLSIGKGSVDLGVFSVCCAHPFEKYCVTRRLLAASNLLLIKLCDRTVP